MQRWWLQGGHSTAVACALLCVVLVAPVAWGQEAAAPTDAAASDSDALAGIRNDFVNFLHFASIGQFEYAKAHAESLLNRPEIRPLTKEAGDLIVQLAEQRPDAVDTLITLINNSTIGDEAGDIMALMREAHRQKYMDADQINKSIRMLAGSQTDRATGLERLVDSGEYAVPQMIGVLIDPRRKYLQPYVLQALPRLGKPAVNPLCAALSIEDDVIRRYVADALGRLGYPQALPYLKRLAVNPSANPEARQAANEAIGRIAVANPKVKDAPPTELFRDLGEAYYDEVESLEAPGKQRTRANVWMVDGQGVKPIDVPRQIFPMIMSMRCAKASLALNKDQPQVLALWLAANFRREARLGLDVQTTDAAVVDDATRPEDFPRSVYFARSAGPDSCQLVLARGVTDLDRPVCLGAIAGLAATANQQSLRPMGRGGPGLAEALRFPDQLVRIRAALVLGRVLPPEPFPGANEVVPVLASAYSITGRKSYLVVDPDEAMAERIAADLNAKGSTVITAARLETGLAAASKQSAQFDGVFLASDISGPGPVEALAMLDRDERFGLVPVVVYVKEGGMPVADRVLEADRRVGRVLVVPGQSPADLLAEKVAQVGPNYGYQPLTAEDGVALSLEATRILQWIAAKESNVFDASEAEPQLVEALNTHASEEVRIGTTRVLALLNTPTAQPAIAAVALSPDQTPTLRLAAFDSLAESSRRMGNRLSEETTRRLISQAMSEPDLELRTAASQALGSTIDMPGELAVEAILNDTRGG